MRWFGSTLVLCLLGSNTALFPEDKVHTTVLNKKDLGKVPSGWIVAKTGKGKGSEWKVIPDSTAPSGSGLVLTQTAESPGSLFNLCVLDNSRAGDVEVRVAFKALRGELDQGGGIVWRYQDANNYYIARMNPLEDNYRLYKVVAGKRTQLEGKENVKVPVGEWHVLKIRQRGERIECFLDDQQHLTARDGTFAKAGKAGLWTKADAQTSFDGFQMRNLKE